MHKILPDWSVVSSSLVQYVIIFQSAQIFIGYTLDPISNSDSLDIKIAFSL